MFRYCDWGDQVQIGPHPALRSGQRRSDWISPGTSIRPAQVRQAGGIGRKNETKQRTRLFFFRHCKQAREAYFLPGAGALRFETPSLPAPAAVLPEDSSGAAGASLVLAVLYFRAPFPVPPGGRWDAISQGKESSGQNKQVLRSGEEKSGSV